MIRIRGLFHRRFSCFHMRQHFAWHPQFLAVCVESALRFLTPVLTREKSDSSKLRPIIKNDRIHNKEKGSPGAADAPGSARKSSTDAKFWQLLNRGRCLPMVKCTQDVCIYLYLLGRFFAQMRIFVSRKNLFLPFCVFFIHVYINYTS